MPDIFRNEDIALSKMSDAQNTRERKIELFKKKRELQKQIDALQPKVTTSTTATIYIPR